MSRAARALGALMIGAFAARAGLMAWRASATYDEPYYLALGYFTLAQNDYKLRFNQSLLPAKLHALPLLPLSLTPPEFIRLDAAAPEVLLRVTRMTSVLLGVLLAWLVWASASALGGEAAGLIALFLTTLDPNMLAHAALATNDMPVTAFAFASAWTLVRYLQKSTSARAAVWGAATAAALLSKYSALFLGPAALLLIALDGARRPRWWRSRGPHAAAAAAAAVAAFLVVYGPAHLGEYWEGLRRNNVVMLTGYKTFFAGRTSVRGFWYYFFGAIALKTPVPVLILAVPALAAGFFRREMRWLSIHVAILLIASAFVPLQLGLRYVLPVYPFLFVLAALLAVRLKPAAVPAALLAAAVFASVAAAPDYLTYFNELAGGPNQGWRWLADCNYDWGQDLGNLRDYVQRENVDAVVLSYFGTATEGGIGFPFQDFYSNGFPYPVARVNADAPRREILAVSATNLQTADSTDLGGPPLEWLKSRAPCARVGRTIFVYDASSDARLHEWLANEYLIGGRWPQGRREVRRALSLAPASPWATLLSALSAKTPAESAALFARAARLDCAHAVPWSEALATPKARAWYAACLRALSVELGRRGRRDLADAADGLLRRPEFAAR